MLLSSKINPEVIGEDWPKVRILWHGAYGSTYQRQNSSGSGQSPPSPMGLGDLSGGNDESMFSRPLICPSCRGSLKLQQLDADSPDRLLGSCSDCQSWAIFDVEDEGRLRLIWLRN